MVSPGELPEVRWRELCAQIRSTDDVSFKLLGFVPLLSLASISATLLTAQAQFSPLLVLACLVGALLTLGFWIWERRNIQTCLWLRERAADLERAAFGEETVGHFARFPRAPGGRGKTQAERFVYGVTLTAWLLVPLAALFVAGPSSAGTYPLLSLYAAAAILIAWRARRETGRSARGRCGSAGPRGWWSASAPPPGSRP